MGAIATAINQRIRPRILAAMKSCAKTTVEEIKESLSTPFPPPSMPGEAPHWRTGNLQAGVVESVEDEGNAITATITSSREKASPDDGDNVPIVLEEYLNRPYMRPAMNRSGDLLRSTIKSTARGGGVE